MTRNDFRRNKGIFHEDVGRTMRQVKLSCGHASEGFAVAVFPGGKEYYRCSEGCGLQRRVR